MKDANMLRLIAAMLADIHASTDAGRDSGLNGGLVRDLLWKGHEWALAWEYGGLFEEEPEDPDVEYVTSVLTMWRAIEDSYAALSETEREELARRVARLPPEGPQFEGFDANTESRCYGIARVLVEDLGRYEEFAKRKLNSHHTTSHAYQAQLRTYEQLGSPVSLKLDQIAQLLTP